MLKARVKGQREGVKRGTFTLGRAEGKRWKEIFMHRSHFVMKFENADTGKVRSGQLGVG